MSKLHSVGAILVVSAMCLICPLASAQTAVPLMKKGLIVQGGREAIGPKQDDPKAVSEGDCTGTATVLPGTGTSDPAARKGIIVQGGREAIGPKQDDPRAVASSSAMRAIGPKQDDPRAGTACQGKKTKL